MTHVNTALIVLPIRRVEISPQEVRSRPHGARKASRTVRPSGFRIEFVDAGRRTANFFSNVWRDIKELFLPAHALGEEQLACVKYLREAGIGKKTNRLALGREMTRMFNREFYRVFDYGVRGRPKATRGEAIEAAAKAVVKAVVKKEKAAGRWISKEARDLLRRNLESLKGCPPAAIQSNKLGKTGNWAGTYLPEDNLSRLRKGPPAEIQSNRLGETGNWAGEEGQPANRIRSLTYVAWPLCSSTED